MTNTKTIKQDYQKYAVVIYGNDEDVTLFDTETEAIEYAETLAEDYDEGETISVYGLVLVKEGEVVNEKTIEW